MGLDLFHIENVDPPGIETIVELTYPATVDGRITTPPTDVDYELTARDQFTGAVKTYSNISGASGQLCGAADTSAFPP